MITITKYLLSVAIVFSMASLSFAGDMDKGSHMDMDKGSMMDIDVGEEEDNTVDAKAIVEEAAEAGSMEKTDSSKWSIAQSAKAVITGTGMGSKIKGTVDLVETSAGVQVVAALSGVTPSGNHGIHIHEKGSCDDVGKAAGGHFNPAGTDHGFLPRDGHGKAHTGDMGNIEIDESGNGSLVIFLPGLSLTDGQKNVVNKAVILHEKEDDFGQPTGNAGGRIGCGIITLNK